MVYEFDRLVPTK